MDDIVFTPGIESRIPYEVYAQTPGISITRLKELKRSPQHYRYRLANPRTSDAMSLGTAAHAAILEPERFAAQFTAWTARTDGGAMAPRRGAKWESFVADNAGKQIVTADELALVQAMAAAVRSDERAMKYLASGDPEVTLAWIQQNGWRKCKGRVDWMTTNEDGPVLVGLKTARDCRHFAFGSAAAKLSYHLQWAYYFDGYEALTGKQAKVVEIVVENDPPHAVAVYVIPNDILEQGRAEYEQLLEKLAECEQANEWPGPVEQEEFLTLPSWVYERQEDVGDLGFE